MKLKVIAVKVIDKKIEYNITPAILLLFAFSMIFMLAKNRLFILKKSKA